MSRLFFAALCVSALCVLVSSSKSKPPEVYYTQDGQGRTIEVRVHLEKQHIGTGTGYSKEVKAAFQNIRPDIMTGIIPIRLGGDNSNMKNVVQLYPVAKRGRRDLADKLKKVLEKSGKLDLTVKLTYGPVNNSSWRPKLLEYTYQEPGGRPVTEVIDNKVPKSHQY